MTLRVISGLALAVFLSAALARADEIRLKDGSKIIGTIVGFENESFRVETAYGFALVQKDKVADISITAPKKESEPKTKPSAATTLPPMAPVTEPARAKEPESRAKPNSSSVSSASKTTNPLPIAKESTSPLSDSPEQKAQVRDAAGPTEKPSADHADKQPAITQAKALATAPSAPAPAPAPTPVPAPQPGPPVIRDEIRGNTYVNLTYGFQMYKPPSWDLIPDARKALPDAVAALGTYDQTTLLVIGRQHTKESLDAHAAATGKALSDVYENYRLISSKHVSIAGVPAVQQRSRGTADGRDWSVTLLTFLKGNDAFTLLGMTWADSDLIQVQENVIAKAVNSITFAAQ